MVAVVVVVVVVYVVVVVVVVIVLVVVPVVMVVVVVVVLTRLGHEGVYPATCTNAPNCGSHVPANRAPKTTHGTCHDRQESARPP